MHIETRVHGSRPTAKYETQVCSVLDSGRGRPVRRILVAPMRGRPCADQPTQLAPGSIVAGDIVLLLGA